MRSGGWGSLTDMEAKAGERAKEADARRMQIAEKAYAIFETSEGREVLEWLLDRTLRRASVPRIDVNNLLVTFDQLAPYATFREGQNSVVLDLVDMLRAVEKRRDKK